MFADRRRLVYLALLIAILVALRVQWSRLKDPYTIQDDFRKFHWMHRFEDPELFVDDPLTAAVEVRLGSLRLFVDKTRPGYSLLFFLASPIFPPVIFNKLLIFPLLLLSVYFLFRIGEIVKDPDKGFALALSFIVLTTLGTTSTSVAAGLPRSFMAPLILGIVFFLMTDRYWIAIGIALISATIYLPAAVFGITIIAFVTIESTEGPWRYRIIWRRILPLVVFFVLLLLLMPIVVERLQGIWTIFFEQNWSFGKILRDPNYSRVGRWALIKDFPFMGLGGLVDNYSELWILVTLTPLSAAIYILRPDTYKNFPRILKLLFIVSVILYLLAWLAIFLTSSIMLYFPSRYTRLSLALALLLFVVINLGPPIRIFRTRFQKLERTPKVLTITTTVVAALTIYLLLEQYDIWSRLGANRTSLKVILIVVFAFLIGTIILISLSKDSIPEPLRVTERLAGKKEFSILVTIVLAALILIGLPPDNHGFFTIEPPTKDLMTFFQTIPKDSLTAGYPCSLDYVPIAARRQILFSCEFFPQNASDRIMDNMRAYYSNSLSEVLDFCDKYGVDYFVVVPRTFNISEDMFIYFEPYNSVLYPEVASQAGYVLGDIPQSMRVYDGEKFIVMQCDPDDIGELTNQATQIDGLGILAHDEVSSTLSQAGEVDMTVKWIADKEILADYEVCFSIKNSNGESKQKVCEPLSPDLPTSQWSIPEIRYETYKFRISPYLESGAYSILASINTRKEVDDRFGIVIGEITYSALPRTFNTSKINSKLAYDVIWGDVIALSEYDVTNFKSNTLELDVRWHALKRMGESYKTFAHLREAGTNVIAGQIDAIPRNWTYPTDWWEANEIVTDTLSIPLNDLGPGRYELWLGFYNDESGERLPLADSINPTLSTKEEAVKIYDFEQPDLGMDD